MSYDELLQKRYIWGFCKIFLQIFPTLKGNKVFETSIFKAHNEEYFSTKIPYVWTFFLPLRRNLLILSKGYEIPLQLANFFFWERKYVDCTRKAPLFSLPVSDDINYWSLLINILINSSFLESLCKLHISRKIPYPQYFFPKYLWLLYRTSFSHLVSYILLLLIYLWA